MDKKDEAEEVVIVKSGVTFLVWLGTFVEEILAIFSEPFDLIDCTLVLLVLPCFSLVCHFFFNDIANLN